MVISLEIAQQATLRPIEEVGLARESAAVNVDITETGRTVGLF